MKLKIYQIDTFTGRLFSGNPAAVVPLHGKWLKTGVMQSIAAENNLSETAFYLNKNGKYHIRWFTPLCEVDLCGHATLASAFTVFYCEKTEKKDVVFYSRSGMLGVRKDGEYLTMDFPADKIRKIRAVRELNACFSFKPAETIKGRTDYMLVYDSEKQVRNIKVDFKKLAGIKARGIIVTAKGKKYDFVSRFFAPACGINEDPVTGSAHTTLAPYWSLRLGKAGMTAAQLSGRGGLLKCADNGGRVVISGKAVLYMTGEIHGSLCGSLKA